MIRVFLKANIPPEAVYARRPEYATIDNISRENLLAFHQLSIGGRNLMIGVVGDFHTAEMKRMLQAASAELPAGEALQPRYPEVNYSFPDTANLAY
jgi:zinc protease